MKKKPGPLPLDIQIGARLKTFRLQRELSQSELGAALGVTFQQIQKYEKGQNRLSGSRLVQACEVLNVKAEQLLGNGAAIHSDEPDVLAVLKDKDMLRMLLVLTKLAPSKRHAVLTAMVELARGFERKL
jgi:transcriptional regulator with XRE-family HTH domain